jgi:UDP-glucose 4-epimerase
LYLDNNQFRRALVTGGAGFIGSHIVEALLNLNIEVVSIDNYSGGKRENLAHLKSNIMLKEVDCDITDYNQLNKYFNKIDIVFHNAASKKTICLKDPRKDLQVNAEGTYNVMELSRNFGVKKVVHASTGSVYGEAQYRPQDENHPLNPMSYYGVSKLAGEKYALAFGSLYNMNVTVLRYFHVYGPRQESADQRGGVVAIFCRRALAKLPLIIYGDGTQERSFTYVGDLVNANLLVANSPLSNGQVYNCASGLKITIKELAEKIVELNNCGELPINYEDWTPGDIKIFDINNKKISSLGLSKWISFNEGLEKTIKWYKSN